MDRYSLQGDLELNYWGCDPHELCVYEFFRMLGLIGKIFYLKKNQINIGTLYLGVCDVFIYKLYYNNNIKAGDINRIILFKILTVYMKW